MEKKIPIKEENEKEEKKFSRKEIVHQEKEKELEKLYQNKELLTIQKPPKISSETLIKSILISFFLGLIFGFILALYLFSKNLIPHFKF
jgi:hypothetical protein